MTPTVRPHALAAIPVFGDTTRLAEVLDGLQPLNLDTLVVNDGNGKSLTDHLRGQDIEVIDLGVNCGVGVATQAALRAAHQRGYRGLMTLDADGAHDPLSIQLLLNAAMESPDDPVITCRFGQSRDRFIPETKLAANKFASTVFSAVTGLPVTADVACGLRYYPNRFAVERWSEDRFGFLYESLEAIRHGPHHSVGVWVDYPGAGPHLTADRELRDFLSWGTRRAKGEIRASLRSLVDELDDQTRKRSVMPVSATLDGLHFTFDFVPSRRAWLIARLDSEASPDKFLDLPKSTELAIGIIPDGGRRWAKRHGVSLDQSYERTIRALVAFLEAQRERVSSSAVYWLSGANLLRPAPEVEASLRAARLFVDLLTQASFSPVILGDLSRLPAEFRDWAVGMNTRAAIERRPLVWIALAYTPFWQEVAFHPPHHPRELGFSPDLVAALEGLRLDTVFRSGGARTLSDFMPTASSYALLTFEQALFNDCDLTHWIDAVLSELPRVRYGT